ncbi:MAG: enoyl-CoA hydratase-related protein [Actinomycetota bacterium]|nr:enoyl-CoA hydratase-related protein [Actinomycetota bacterium]
MAQLIETGESDGVLTITLNSPANRNALSALLRSELLAALDAAAISTTARVVVLSHSGPVFCSGMDLRENATTAPGSEGGRELPRILQQIARCPKPVIARVGGTARAGGIGLLAAADVVVTVTGATFAFLEIRLGLIPAVISVPVLRRVSTTAARELLLTGAVFDATRAREIGLANAVVEPDALDDEVDRYARLMKLGGPGALAETKAMLSRQHDDSDARYEALLQLSAHQFAGPEGKEGGRAFLEKRPPRWA